jgi:hypothetical protein
MPAIDDNDLSKNISSLAARNKLSCIPIDEDEAKQFIINFILRVQNRILDINSIEIKVLYLNSLLSRGLLLVAKEFIENLGEDAKEVINYQHTEFYEGTIIHTLLYWNSECTSEIIEFFKFLLSIGAEFKLNTYDELPLEQIEDGAHWNDMFTRKLYNKRNPNEFVGLYKVLNEIYEQYCLSKLLF